MVAVGGSAGAGGGAVRGCGVCGPAQRWEMASAAARVAARRAGGFTPTETPEERRERRKRERRDAELKLQKEAAEAKEALAAARRAEADAKKEEDEATEAEAQALQEEREAEEAREQLKKEEEDVQLVEATVSALEKRLAQGEDVSAELETQRQTLQREQQEVDEARVTLEKELREAREAKAAAAKEKAEALAARAKAVEAAMVAAKELREAEEAAWDKGQTNWVLSRVEAHDPLAEDDMLYRVVFFPLKTKLLEDRDAVLTKVGKRKIDNLINTIHRQWCVRQPAVNTLRFSVHAPDLSARNPEPLKRTRHKVSLNRREMLFARAVSTCKRTWSSCCSVLSSWMKMRTSC